MVYLDSFLLMALVRVISLVLLISTTPALSACECGYSVSGNLYTELLETDFLHLPKITLDTDWRPQDYTVSTTAARASLGKNASLANVVANPLANNDTWIGAGSDGGDGGLQLWVRALEPRSNLVSTAEVSTMREDMLYGSFRAAIKVTDVPGTCTAFFWYFNDTQEIDVELLSRQFNSTSNPVNLVLQSPAAEQAGDDASGTPSFSVIQLPFSPSGEFHEYRFDWTPENVTFFADGQPLKTMAVAVPSSPGHILLSQWSDGNPNWSGGPPTKDSVSTVSYFKAYFNSSETSRQQQWADRCKDLQAPNATCPVPDQTTAPDSNSSTFFFATQPNSTINQTVWSPSQTSDALPSRSMVLVYMPYILTLVIGIIGIVYLVVWLENLD
ncbi:hypothetical protein MMC25_002638 [Agyrium rufum]|nr:hypothetical protein [Agyrium rufum]